MNGEKRKGCGGQGSGGEVRGGNEKEVKGREGRRTQGKEAMGDRQHMPYFTVIPSGVRISKKLQF